MTVAMAQWVRRYARGEGRAAAQGVALQNNRLRGLGGGPVVLFGHMRQELREAAFVALLVAPVAIVANGLGFVFLLALEGSRNPVVWAIGYLIIPIGVGACTFGLAFWSRPRTARFRTALLLRPSGIYLFFVAIAWWLWNGRSDPDLGMVAPVAIPAVAACLSGLCIVVWRARPLGKAPWPD